MTLRAKSDAAAFTRRRIAPVSSMLAAANLLTLLWLLPSGKWAVGPLLLLALVAWRVAAISRSRRVIA